MEINNIAKLLGVFLCFCISPLKAQGIFTSISTGNWNSTSSWTLSSGIDEDNIPDSNDNVTIGAHTITLQQDESCSNLTITTPTSTAPTNKLALDVFTLNISGGLSFGTLPNVDNYISSSVGTGRIKFIGSSNRTILTSNARFGNQYEVEIAVDPTTIVIGSGNLKFRALYVTSGIFNHDGFIYLDNGVNGSIDSKVVIGSSGELIISGSLGARNTTNSSYCGRITVDGVLNTSGTHLNAENITINGTLIIKGSGGLVSLPNDANSPEFEYGPNAIVEYSSINNNQVSMGDETGRASTTINPVLPHVKINVGTYVTSASETARIKILEFISGNLRINSDVTIVEAGEIIGYGANNYIQNGNFNSLLMRENVGSTLTVFPIGTTVHYTPVEILNIGTPDLFGVSVQDVAPTNTCITPATSATHKWRIHEETLGGSNCTISLTRVNVGTSYEPVSAQVVHCPGGNNMFDYADGSGEVNNKVTGSGFTDFVAAASSSIAFGIGSTASPLPVKFSEITIKNKGNANLVSFSTLSELNNNYFEIERSADGFEFEMIGYIKGAGSSNKEIFYTFMDEKPMSGINYYRVKQVDFDGQSEYSEVKSIVTSQSNTVITPRYTYDMLDIRTEAALYTASIYNTTGQLVLQMDQLTGSKSVDLSSFVNGVYIVNVITGNQKESFKITKL
jgi:hypothetical protein